MKYLFWLPCVFFLLCSCATSPMVQPQQQRLVPVVIEEGNFSYSLLYEKKSHLGKFFLLPILEKQIVDENISRLYFRVGIKKQTGDLVAKGFLQMQGFNGEKAFGIISGFEETSVVIEIDLPIEDMLNQNQAMYAWFAIECEDSTVFQSKKIKIKGGGDTIKIN